MADAPSIVINLPGYPFQNLASTSAFDALRALPSSSLVAGQDYAVDGSDAFGDGGGGLFVWAPASLMDDDDATVVKPSDLTNLQAGRWLLGGGKQLRAAEQAATDALASQVLAYQNGSGIGIGYKRSEASAVEQTVKAKLDEQVSVASWGVTGGDAAHDTPLINKAIAECPPGKTLFFPKLAGGNYLVNDTIVHANPVNILFDRAVQMVATFNDATKDVWKIGFTSGPDGNNDSRYMWMRDATIGILPGHQARDTVHLENVAPLAGILNYGFYDCGFGANDDQTGYALRIVGLETQLHKIIGCQIVNGIKLENTADAIRIFMSQIFGTKTGVTLDLKGVFNTYIGHNAIVCRDGAIQGSASQVDILYNQMEQVAAENVSPSKAMVAIGAAPGFKARRNVIIGNNFGGGFYVDRNLYLDSDTCDTIIDENTFNITNSGVDIAILSADVKYTRIGPNNQPRGNRNGVVIDQVTGVATPLPGAVGNQLDPADMLAVLDAGTGTIGSRRLAADTYGGLVPGIGLTNGWTANAGFMYYKDLEETFHFRGRFIAGSTVASNTLICTLPVGFRPSDQVIVLVPYGGAGFNIGLKIDVNGEIRTVGTGSGASLSSPLSSGDQLELAAASFIVNRQGYDPGV